jgi:hypothetical protein
VNREFKKKYQHTAIKNQKKIAKIDDENSSK